MSAILYGFYRVLREIRMILPFIVIFLGFIYYFLMTKLCPEGLANEMNVFYYFDTNPGWLLLTVFIFNLIYLGRMNLAILSWLPLLISWVGINIPNALIFSEEHFFMLNTFVILPGIYYSTFVTNQAVKSYSSGEKNMKPNWMFFLVSGIFLLVGLTSIFVGTEDFKKLGFIFIVSILLVNLISFLIVPWLFKIIVVKRSDNKLEPLTAWAVFCGSIGFMTFLISSQIFTVLSIVPMGGMKGRRIRERILSWYGGFFMSSVFNLKTKFIGFEVNPFKNPSMIISNHRTFLDITAIMSLSSKLVMLTNDWVRKSRFTRILAKFSTFYPVIDGYEGTVQYLGNKAREGYSVTTFPEGRRSPSAKMLRFHKGAFLLAEQMDLDIQPLVMLTSGDIAKNGGVYIKRGRLIVKKLDRIKTTDTHMGTTYQEKSKAIRKYMVEELDKLRIEYETPSYLRKAVINSFKFKYPEIEWLAKSELRKHKNYESFHSNISPDAKITELGCTYGFLTFMLYLLSPERKVVAVDNERENIQIAQNCYQVNENIYFEWSCYKDYQFTVSDVFVINRISKNYNEDDKEWILNACLKNLAPGGKIIINKTQEFLSDNKITKLVDAFGLCYVADGIHGIICIIKSKQEAKK